MDLSLSQYADDTTKQIVAKLGEDVQALAKRVQCSNDVFDRTLAVDGFSQNRGKEELLMHLVGEGSLADRRLVRDGKVSLPGKVVTVARHLGSHLGEKASFTHELPRRRQATMAAFYSVGQLWYESRVSWRLKKMGVVVEFTETILLLWAHVVHWTGWERPCLASIPCERRIDSGLEVTVKVMPSC